MRSAAADVALCTAGGNRAERERESKGKRENRDREIET